MGFPMSYIFSTASSSGRIDSFFIASQSGKIVLYLFQEIVMSNADFFGVWPQVVDCEQVLPHFILTFLVDEYIEKIKFFWVFL